MNDFGETSSQTMSLSDAIKKSANEMLFNTLLNNPEKRAKVLELLTQEGIVNRRDENSSPNSPRKYCSPIKRLQKNDSLLNSPMSKNSTPKSKNAVRLESPSALGRRRALQRLESDSSVELSPKVPSPPFVGTPKPFERLLEGVVAYCEIRNNGEDRSAAIKTYMQSMGAKIKDNLYRGVTHVILKDGLYTTYRKAKMMKIHVVSVLWLEAVRKHKFRVPESKFPAACPDAYDADLTKICQEFQKDYNDVIQDELNKSVNPDVRRRSESPIKFVTERKKSTKFRSTIYGSDLSTFKDAHNRTEIASPYRFKCPSPELSESDSYISVGSNSNKNTDIIPCSQDDPTYLSINHSKNTNTTKPDEEDDVFPESNLAKNVKDSFELEKASKIRSPDSLINKSFPKTVARNSAENNDSLRLHISTTDDSNLNSTGKSKSNSRNSKNLLENNLSSNKQSSESKKLSSNNEMNLHLSSESNEINHKNIDNDFGQNMIDDLPQIIINNMQKNFVPISKPGSSISTVSSDLDINKNKTRRRTIVGLKRNTKIVIQSENLNLTIGSDIGTKTVLNTLKRKHPLDSTETSISSIDTITKITSRKIVKRKIGLDSEKSSSSSLHTIGATGTTGTTDTFNTNDTIDSTENKKIPTKKTPGKIANRKTLLDSKESSSVSLNTIGATGTTSTTDTFNTNDTIDSTENKNKIPTKKTPGKIAKRKTLLDSKESSSLSLHTIGATGTTSTTDTFNTNDTIDSTENKKTNDVKRRTRRQTMYKLSDTDEETQKSTVNLKRKTIANLNTPNKKSVRIKESTNNKNKKNSDSEVEKNITTRKSQRKTISSTSSENDQNFQNTKSDSTAEKPKPRVRKLYDPNTRVSASQIIWDDEPKDEEKDIVSPLKIGKYHIPVKGLPKILSAKALKKTMTSIKSTAKSVPAKITKNISDKNKRKSARALNFNSTSSESDSDINKPNVLPKTPSRKSERIAKTPSKNFKISDSEDENKNSDANDLKKYKSVIYSSQETGSSQSSLDSNKKIKKPDNIRKKLLKKTLPKKSSSDENTKTDDDRKRRSTFDFVPQKSKESLERIKLSQKSKKTTRLPSIVCTRFHKSDVLVFQQIVKKLGGFVVEDEVTKRTTHLIAGSPSRTVNMLRAIVRGCWIVSQDWLYKSLEAEKWLEEEDFEMTDFSPTVQKCRIERQSFGSLYSMDLFTSCGTIFISRSSTPRFSDLEELVELCGGRVVRFPRDAQLVVAEHADHEGAVCVNEKWILDSITQNKLRKYRGYLI